MAYCGCSIRNECSSVVILFDHLTLPALRKRRWMIRGCRFTDRGGSCRANQHRPGPCHTPLRSCLCSHRFPTPGNCSSLSCPSTASSSTAANLASWLRYRPATSLPWKASRGSSSPSWRRSRKAILMWSWLRRGTKMTRNTKHRRSWQPPFQKPLNHTRSPRVSNTRMALLV